MPVNEDLISYLINYLLYQPCPIFSRIMVFMSCPILFASMSVSVSVSMSMSMSIRVFVHVS